MMKLLTILIAVLLFSCKVSETQNNSEPLSVEQPKNLVHEVTEIKSGTNGAFLSKEEQVITNNEQFQKVWDQVFANYMNKEALPTIDFKTKTVLLVTMGEQRSGGYTIAVNSITEHNDMITVTVVETKPGSNCMNTSVITYPFQIVEIEKSQRDKKFVFNRTEEIYECD